MAKKNKNENLDKLNAFFKDIKERRKNVPGFDSFYKLVLWFVFIVALLVLTAIYARTPVTVVPSSEKPLPANAFSYKELLENRIKEDSKYVMDIEFNGNKSRLEATVKESNIEGYLENETSTDKIIIKNNEIYKVKFDNEELLTDFELNVGILNVVSLIKTLENNKSLKTVNENIINYQYNISVNEINYTIDTKVEDKAVNSITVNNENSKYTIVFK